MTSHYNMYSTCLLYTSLGHNSLTDTTMAMDQEKPAGSVPNTFVPGRNLFFLSIAAVYARERGINHLAVSYTHLLLLKIQ